MALREAVRRLIVNADDFGRTSSINHAVIRAHREGILTSASLMVNGAAFAEAVELARQNPRLGVGLHLALVCGRATLPPSQIPGLVDEQGEFSRNAVGTGLRYFFRRELSPQLTDELRAQFEKFQRTGLRLDHVNGHLNMHLHPTVFGILGKHAREWGIQTFRLTKDPFWLNARIAVGNWFYRASHALIYLLLSRHARPQLDSLGVRYSINVFGLLQNSRVHEDFLLKLIPRLPAGDSEIYSHPSLDEFKPEFDALVSPRVRSLMESENIRLVRYQDL
ncbi:MAG: hopanoid biosynthesis-associated protein HpnK [Verrucomicrobia bacterium]|nr:hopanoid biosynthesis-associated protein HpnK [Verrucomicrobiota bacterium]